MRDAYQLNKHMFLHHNRATLPVFGDGSGAALLPLHLGCDGTFIRRAGTTMGDDGGNHAAATLRVMPGLRCAASLCS
jgi:hypothetical protein